MTDENQNIVWEAEYLPFGEVYQMSGTIENNLRFPGQYYDSETGLHYNWHRYYKAEVGRYMRGDPVSHYFPAIRCNGTINIVFSNKDLLNIYSYVRNNPINYKDLKGLFSIKGDCCGKEETIRKQVQRACNILTIKITDISLRKCIEERCRNAAIECEKECSSGLLGYNYGFLWFRFHTAHICVNNPTSAGLFGEIAIHEWAHSCGWEHGQDKGVPGDNGYLP